MTRFATAILALLFSMSAAAWWSEEWTQRKTLSVDTSATGAALQQGLTEVPVLVRLHAGNFPQFLTVRENGADFRFIAGDDQTPLKYHVERFDPIAELAFVWVKMPVLNAASTQDFYLYFGNLAAPRGDDPGASFDVSTVAAYHFDRPGALPLDSTAYGTPVISGAPLPNPASLIGAGATLGGVEPMVIGDAPQLQFTADGGFTVSLWARVNALPEVPGALLDRPGGGFRVALDAANGLSARYGDAEIRSFAPFTAGEWHHVTVTVDGSQLQLFLDGTQVGGAPVAAAPQTGPIYVGGGADGSDLLEADIDELRIASVARTADWVGFAAAVQGVRNDQVMGYSVDESSEAGEEGGVGNFGIIFQSVFGNEEAIVEQLVIGLCGIMMVIAIAIMFLKTLDLKRAGDSSATFLKAYGQLGTAGGAELDALYDEGQRLGQSPLWRVYHVGIGEIRRRLGRGVGAAAAGLDSKALGVVRAAMDAAMVRESQRLNSQLVLLTIAISGGPFIGLLGTVVGVMVTFAAIAATGDVNIAAIAPGMAAALLATVAGLGVAIPSLFGYNWLSSKAKELTADMRVFADELEARFNERYGA